MDAVEELQVSIRDCARGAEAAVSDRRDGPRVLTAANTRSSSQRKTSS